MSPNSTELFQGGTRQFGTTAADEYDNPIAIPADAQWEADPSIGMINSTGIFTAATTNDSGWVRLRWQGVVDSARDFGSGSVRVSLDTMHATVQYRIRQITNDGGQEVTQPIAVNTGTNSVGPK